MQESIDRFPVLQLVVYLSICCRFLQLPDIPDELFDLEDILNEAIEIQEQAAANQLPQPLDQQQAPPIENQPGPIDPNPPQGHPLMVFDGNSDNDNEDYLRNLVQSWENLMDIPSYRLLCIMRSALRQPALIGYNILDIENPSYLSLQDDYLPDHNTTVNNTHNQ